MKNIFIKTLSILLAALFAFGTLSLYSCNSTKDKNKKDPDNGEQAEEQENEAYKDYAMSVLEISTENGSVKSKVVAQKCSVSTAHTEDENKITDQSAKIKGYGWSTWRMTKKSYLLSFDEKVNLFNIGSGAAKDWVLAANFADFTMQRSHLAYTVAKNVLTNIPYVTGSTFVQLYVNGEYEGVYEVLEMVQFDENRLDYTFEPGVNDTNYLVRLDFEADIQIDSDSTVNYFAISSKKYYIENEGMTAAQLSYVSAAYNSMMTAIGSGNQKDVEALIDIDSAVDMYILHEFFKNSDVGFSGFYTVKEKGGKIVFTAPWDFYRCAGNDESIGDYSSKNLFAGDGVTKTDGSNPIFYRLIRRTWFVDKVVARWNEIKDELANVHSSVNEFDNIYGADIEANFTKWRGIGEKNDNQPEEVVNMKSYVAQVRYLQQWIYDRYAWLDSHINSSAFYSQVKS